MTATILPWIAAKTAAEVQQRVESALADIRVLDVANAADAELVPLALSLKAAADYVALVHAEIEKRAITLGRLVPGAAVKDAIVHRIWSDPEAAADLARSEIGEAAFTTPTLKSPAQMEKLGAKGKAFVELASEKPPAGKKVVY